MQKVDFKALGFKGGREDGELTVCISCYSSARFHKVVDIMVDSELLTFAEGRRFKNHYEVYGENSVICPLYNGNRPAYGNKSYHEGKNDTIYSYEEFLRMIKASTVESVIENLDKLLKEVENEN